MPPTKVLLDTNFLLLPYQFKVDIFTDLERLLEIEHRYVISSSTLRELDKLSKNRGVTGVAAKFGKKVIEMRKDMVEVVETRMPVDNWLVEYAEAEGAIVCTSDIKLKNKLRRKGVRIITLKGKTRLGFV